MSTKKPSDLTHPLGEPKNPAETPPVTPLSVDTFNGKVHIEWDPEGELTQLGQLPFFIQFLKAGHLFEPWVESCPLQYHSNNASRTVNVLGSLLLSILSGHRRYSHITSLLGERVNSELLGMSKVVSNDSARRALERIDEAAGVRWLQHHLTYSYAPLLSQPWILDCDTTVKPLYGRQEGAEVGYNPHKPGRPSHTYHTYFMANVRLVLDVEVQSGKCSAAGYSAPGLWSLLEKWPRTSWPRFIRGDCDWGQEAILCEAEQRGVDYLFKMRKSLYAQKLLHKLHFESGWTTTVSGWEAIETTLQLKSWSQSRRVVVTRRRLTNELAILPEGAPRLAHGQQTLAFVEPAEKFAAYEYAVLVTSLKDEVITIAQHYRDRADCENGFDEMKNQWGWGGFVTQDLKRCRFIARIVALIYNWWTLFVRLADPNKHTEAITSRPLLLHSIGRQTKHAGQTRITITTHHGQERKIAQAYQRITGFFTELKRIAQQLTPLECWCRILAEAMKKYLKGEVLKPPDRLLLST